MTVRNRTWLRAYRARLAQATRDGVDPGFTLVEVVVALTVVMFVFAALAAGIVISQQVQRTSEARNAAVQFAQKILSQDTVGGWSTTGFCPGDPNLQSTGYNGETTVVLNPDPASLDTEPCGNARSAAVPHPDSSNDSVAALTVGNQVFSYTNSITWALDSSTGVTSVAADQNNPNATDLTYDYKRVVVTVAYTVNNNAKTLTQSTLLASDPNDPSALPVPGSTPPGACDLALTSTPFCGVSATSGYVGVAAATTALTTSTDISFTISTPSGTDPGSAATVTYCNGVTATSTVTQTMTLDSTTYASAGYPPFWKYTVTKPATVLLGSCNVVFSVTIGGTVTTYTLPVTWRKWS